MYTPAATTQAQPSCSFLHGADPQQGGPHPPSSHCPAMGSTSSTSTIPAVGPMSSLIPIPSSVTPIPPQPHSAEEVANSSQTEFLSSVKSPVAMARPSPLFASHLPTHGVSWLPPVSLTHCLGEPRAQRERGGVRSPGTRDCRHSASRLEVVLGWALGIPRRTFLAAAAS